MLSPASPEMLFDPISERRGLFSFAASRQLVENSHPGSERRNRTIAPGFAALNCQTIQWDRWHISGRTASGPSVYLYDGFNTIEELDATGNILARYHQGPGIDQPMAELRSGTIGYYEADGVGSVTSLSSSSASLSDTYAYDSFGKLTASTGELINPFQYTSREFDQETGLSYYRARTYDANIGRFISGDPIGFGGGTNLYAYTWNSPIVFTDPTGFDPCLNINSFVNALNNNAEEVSTGQCAKYLRWALEAGGANTSGHPGSAKDYGPFLEGLGFSEVPTDNYSPQIGDTVVFQPYPGGNQNGHTQAWNGTQWVSDFPQPYPPNAPGGIYPGAGYRGAESDYSIYRPTPCPTSTAEQTLLQRLTNWVRSFF
jgi:RHS repeat-associated protein